MDKLSCQKRKDPVARLVMDMTPHEVVQWMIEYHGLPFVCAETIERTLREQFKFHRLQGRLDQRSNLAILADLLRLRQSVKILERRPEPVEVGSIQDDFATFCVVACIPEDHLGIELIFKAFAANWTPTLK